MEPDYRTVITATILGTKIQPRSSVFWGIPVSDLLKIIY